MMSSEQGLEQLIIAARAGAEPAWREIYGELAPVVLGYLRGRGAAEPEDVTGEVFLQVVRDLDRFDGGWRAFRAWVLTIAHHRLLDEGRKRSRRPVDPVAEPPEPAPGPVPHVEEEISTRHDLVRATELLAELSTDQRSVLLLRIVGELTIEEVASVLGKRSGAVKQLQRRGLIAVRKRLEREETRT
jgi:RNA polymerase sigma-70 factor (ECF subfamily)